MIPKVETTTACPALATCDEPEMICFRRAQTGRLDPRTTGDPVELLPPRPAPLPSARRMGNMTKACRAQTLIRRLVNCILEIEGLRAGIFSATPDACPRKRIRNARRRCRRLLERGQELGLWENGRWQLGNSSAWMQ